MNKRTGLLFGLLVVVAIAAIRVRTGADLHSSSLIAPPTLPATIPKPVENHYARIDDQAQILFPFGEKLSRMADSFAADLGVDVHIVTLTARASSIEEQADRVFQTRKIGTAAPTGGVLVVLNPTLGEARIEVGYSLEGTLTDLHMTRLAGNQLAPYASYGAAGMAVMDVLHYLRDELYIASALGSLDIPADLREKPEYLKYQKFASGGAGAKAVISTKTLDEDSKQLLSAEERARFVPSADIQKSIQAFLDATQALAGDPTLDLFTPGSRLMRARYPLARFEELRRLEAIEASKPLEVLQQEDYAVATSRKPVPGFVPILLHRENGKWRIDLVETWKNLFFGNDGNYYLRNSNTPYAPGLAQFGEGQYYDIHALPLDDKSLGHALAELSEKKDLLSTLRRAEIWLRNCFVFPEAFTAYEAARRQAPDDPLILETIGRRALYLGFPEMAIPMLEQVGRGLELTITEAYSDLGDTHNARRWVDAALTENPYDLYALRWLKFLADKDENKKEIKKLAAKISALAKDSTQKYAPIKLYFEPRVPQHDPVTTVDVGGTTVYDHSKFGVWIKNTSKRAVTIESVNLDSTGDAQKSGLGDIKDYWHFPSGEHRLDPGEFVWLERVWGFTVETGHTHVRYVFRTCWRGVDEAVRQCRTQWVDTLPSRE